MKKLVFLLLAACSLQTVHAGEALVLGNDAWPPFILDGSDQGTAERLVCEALERAGWACTVQVQAWDQVLEAARSGAIDGIAAAWHSPERDAFLHYSEPYLTNRIVPVTSTKSPVRIENVDDLAGLRVTLVTEYAYGADIASVLADLEVVGVENAMAAIEAVRAGRADAALVDELVVRDQLSENPEGIVASRTILAFRSLHFAVSRQHPEAERILADFQRAYGSMLADGTVNEILNIDWLATDFGQPGQLNVVLRSGVSLDDLSHPESGESVYALEQSEYQMMQSGALDDSRVKYQVAGESYSSLQSALNTVFGKETACQHKEFSSEFDCTNLFKRR